MDDAAVVGRLQTVGDLDRDRESLIHLNRASDNALIEALSIDHFHHQDMLAIHVFETEEGGHVGVVERGEDLGLTLETGVAFGVSGKVLRKDLERYLTVEGGVGGAPDRTHPALAEHIDKLVVQQFRTG